MVSALWAACAEGNIDSVNELLANATLQDVEIKGTSPSIFISTPRTERAGRWQPLYRADDVGLC